MFPSVPEPQPELTAALEYFRNTTSSIGAAEGAQQKKLAKGKAVSYDPKSDKKLRIYTAKSWPSWQNKYVELVREQLERLGIMDIKEASKKIDKPDMKKAMPFMQTLKRKLDSGQSKEAVLERKLAFDEVTVLKEMAPGLKSTVLKLKEVNIVLIDEDGKTGTDVEGKKIETLGPQASLAEPGNPSFEFTNI